MSSYDDSEPPLDPAALRLRAKMVRLLFVSGGIMVLGLVAVFAAIIYKLNEGGEPAGRLSIAAGETPIEGRLAVPAGARVVATALDGDRVLVTLAAPDGTTSLVLVDLASGAVLARYALAPE